LDETVLAEAMKIVFDQHCRQLRLPFCAESTINRSCASLLFRTSPRITVHPILGMTWDKAERKSAIILAIIAALEGAWVLLNLRTNGWRFVHYLGFGQGQAGHLAGWLAAAVVVFIYILLAARLPSVREHLFRLSALKLIALAVAITAAILAARLPNHDNEGESERERSLICDVERNPGPPGSKHL
jgi:hypothetical protein